MGALMNLDVIRANVWRVIQLRTFLHCTTYPHIQTHMLMHWYVAIYIIKHLNTSKNR